MPKKQLNDIACYQLAIHFLVDEKCDSDESRDALAGAIQQAVEDWFAARESDTLCRATSRGAHCDLSTGHSGHHHWE